MTRLLVVHPDPLVLWDRAMALEHAGYDVETCPGPSATDCPVLQQDACPLLDRADVLIYDVALDAIRDVRFLAARLRDTYADLPLVLVGSEEVAEGAGLDEGPNRVYRVPEVGTVGQFAAVVEEALSEQGMAV